MAIAVCRPSLPRVEVSARTPGHGARPGGRVTHLQAQRPRFVPHRHGRGGPCPGVRLVLSLRSACAIRAALRGGERICVRRVRLAVHPESPDSGRTSGILAGFLLRRGTQSGPPRGGSEVLQLPPVPDRPRAVQRIVRRGAVRDLRAPEPGDGALPDLHLRLRVQLLPVRARDDAHLGPRQRALRLDVGLGRLRAGPVLLLPPRLVAGARVGAAARDLGRRARPALRLRLLALPGRERTEAPLQAGRECSDLGKTRPVPGRASADFRLLGSRAPSELYRRDLHLPRIHAHNRLCLLGALPVARVAGGSAGASLQTRRASLPCQVRELWGRYRQRVRFAMLPFIY